MVQGRILPVAKNEQGVWNIFLIKKTDGFWNNPDTLGPLRATTQKRIEIQALNAKFIVQPVTFQRSKDLYKQKEQFGQNDDIVWVDPNQIDYRDSTAQRTVGKFFKGTVASGLGHFLQKEWPNVLAQLGGAAPVEPSKPAVSVQQTPLSIGNINLGKGTTNKPGEGTGWGTKQQPKQDAFGQDFLYFYEKSSNYYEFTNFWEIKGGLSLPPFGYNQPSINWPTTEHYFQAQKTEKISLQKQIAKLATPRDAFKYVESKYPADHIDYDQNTRSIPKVTPTWDERKKLVMLTALREKFDPINHAELANLLKNTGNRILVEDAQKNDSYWGNGADHLGFNYLGRMLMHIRAELLGAIPYNSPFPYTGNITQPGFAPPVAPTTGYTQPINWPQGQEPNVRNGYISVKDFFQDIMGVAPDQYSSSEALFRNPLFGWQLNPEFKQPDQCMVNNTIEKCAIEHGTGKGIGHILNISRWRDQYPRRDAIEKSKNFQALKISELKKELTAVPQQSGGRFTILIRDPHSPEKTDIRDIMTDKKNNGAVIQMASTFWGPLEGGMYDWKSYLTGMIKHAVQGEIISIATAGATIYRKYFMEKPVYLLDAFFDAKIGDWRKSFFWKIKEGGTAIPTINNTFFNQMQLNDSDIDLFKVGVHQDVPVTLGKAQNPEVKNREDWMLERIDLNQANLVTLLLTSGYSLSGRKNAFEAENNFAKLALKAAYKGTLMAAAAKGKKKVYLTLVGAGAFYNPIEWVGDALDTPENFNLIKQYNLEVYLIYRPDVGRARTAQKDREFLSRMFKFADSINGTQWANNNTLLDNLDTYLKAVYTKGIPSQQVMQDINSALMLKAMPTPPVTPVSPQAKQLGVVGQFLENLTKELKVLEDTLKKQ